MDQKLIDEVLAARARAYDEARPEVVARVHANGKLTARERIAALLDPGSAVEYGVLSGRGESDWVQTTGGVDFLGTVHGQSVVASSTDFTDRGGGYGAGRLGRLLALANEHRWPVVLFTEGGGSRAVVPESAGGRFLSIAGQNGLPHGIFEGMAELAGWVPTAAMVSGPSFAGHATMAAFCDFIVATRGSSIGMGGPPMVEAGFGTRLTPHELGGVEMHEQIGGIELLVDDEPAAIAAVRKYLSYYQDRPSGAAAPAANSIRSIVPNSGPYDMHQVIQALADVDSVFELRPNWATAVITAFGRMGGRSVGFLANQPLSPNGGAINSDAANKIARFVQLCDAYEFPIVSLIDTPGFTVKLPGVALKPQDEQRAERPGVTRHHARPLRALHHRTVPLYSVQVRRAYGLGAAAMAGVGNARSVPALRLAWPTVELGVNDKYTQGFDDIVDPAETRERIIAVMRLTKRSLERATKKRPRDPW